MKNKVSMLVLASVVMIAGCSSKGGVYQKMQPETQTQKPGGNTPTPTPKPEVPKDIAGRLAQLPPGTEFDSDMGEIALKKVGDKWQFTIKDLTNKIFTFDVNKMKKGEVFDETETQKINYGIDLDAKLKIARTNLSYANYGILEMIRDYQGQKVKIFNALVFSQKDKKVPFIKQDQNMTFSGITNAVLTKRVNSKFNYYDIIGKADMTIGANQSTADIKFKYDIDDFKTTMTIKNVNLETGANNTHDDFEFSNEKLHLMDDKPDNKTYLDHRVLDNKEIVGTYRARFQQFKKDENNQQIGIGYTLDGVFGMKKQ